jgi:regulator of sigma E protease
MSLWTYLYIIVAVVLLFGAAVFVHEFGHYWVARRRKMKVEAFAIGFGPKIVGWTRDGIEYSWRWIPAGGFVKLPQMITSEALEGGGESKEPVPPAKPLDKILVAVAGPAMNIVFAFVIATVIYFVGLPILINPPIIGPVAPESEEAALGIREGDRVVSVNGRPVKSWQDITFETATARTNVLAVTMTRVGVSTTYQLKTKVSSGGGLKWLNLDPREHPIVGFVQPGRPAEAAGIKSGDKIVSFDDVPVFSNENMIDLVNKSEGRPSRIVISRKGELHTLTVTPRYDAKEKRGLIGIGFGTGIYKLQKPGPSPLEQVETVVDRTFGTLAALFHSRETGVKPSDLSGPVGIFAVLAIQLKTDWRLALSFMVLLNVNLAIVNMLPIPVLDGGHVIMSIIEAIRRKPVSARIVEYITTAFAVLLISFMLYVTFFDFNRFPIFKSLFKQDTQVEPAKQSTNGGGPAPAPQPEPSPVPAK